jgi:hypothetical protein
MDTPRMNERLLCSIFFGLIYRVYKGRILGKGMPMRERASCYWELLGEQDGNLGKYIGN